MTTSLLCEFTCNLGFIYLMKMGLDGKVLGLLQPQSAAKI